MTTANLYKCKMYTVQEAKNQFFFFGKNLCQPGDKTLTKWSINAYNNNNNVIIIINDNVQILL